MPPLHVQCVSSSSFTGSIYTFAALVTDADGSEVTGLGPDNFRVVPLKYSDHEKPEMVTPVPFNTVVYLPYSGKPMFTAATRGIYFLSVLLNDHPMRGEPMPFAVLVDSPAGSGITLVHEQRELVMYDQIMQRLGRIENELAH